MGKNWVMFLSLKDDLLKMYLKVCVICNVIFSEDKMGQFTVTAIGLHHIIGILLHCIHFKSQYVVFFDYLCAMYLLI